MIHVKQPDNNLTDKKKVNTNICIKPNAKQHYECDEEGLDIFQHTKGINFSYNIYNIRLYLLNYLKN